MEKEIVKLPVDFFFPGCWPLNVPFTRPLTTKYRPVSHSRGAGGSKDRPKALFRFILVRNHSAAWPGRGENMEDVPTAVSHQSPGLTRVTYIFNCQHRIPV